MTTRTQNEQVLEALKAGHALTALEAQQRFGIMRLASRINELREAGHNIISRKVEATNRWGQRVFIAKYSLMAGRS